MSEDRASKVVFDGPSPWPHGKCAACHQRIQPMNPEVVVHRDNAGTSYHRDCWYGRSEIPDPTGVNA